MTGLYLKCPYGHISNYSSIEFTQGHEKVKIETCLHCGTKFVTKRVITVVTTSIFDLPNNHYGLATYEYYELIYQLSGQDKKIEKPEGHNLEFTDKV